VVRVKKRYSYWILVGKPKGTEPLGAPKRSCEYNSELDCQEEDGRVWTGITSLKICISDVLL
jgi:hypothetical protein